MNGLPELLQLKIRIEMDNWINYARAIVVLSHLTGWHRCDKMIRPVMIASAIKRWTRIYIENAVNHHDWELQNIRYPFRLKRKKGEGVKKTNTGLFETITARWRSSRETAEIPVHHVQRFTDIRPLLLLHTHTHTHTHAHCCWTSLFSALRVAVSAFRRVPSCKHFTVLLDHHGTDMETGCGLDPTDRR